MLFFQSNKMDVWLRITARAKQMEADAAHAARRRKEEAKRKKAKEDEMLIILGGLAIAAACIAATIWAVIEGFSQT